LRLTQREVKAPNSEKWWRPNCKLWPRLIAEQTPLEFALQCMRDESDPPGFRLEACKVAMPYVHSKKADEPSQEVREITEIVRVIVPAKADPEYRDDRLNGDPFAHRVVEPGIVHSAMPAKQE
jgi:hypothetical protein